MSYETEAYPDDIAAIKRRMQGTGELLSDVVIGALWGSFSGWMSASWLIVDDGTFGNFAAWLVCCLQAGKVLDGSRAAPCESQSWAIAIARLSHLIDLWVKRAQGPSELDQATEARALLAQLDVGQWIKTL